MNMLRKLILIVALALSAVVVVACGGSNPAPTAATTAAATTKPPAASGAATVAVVSPTNAPNVAVSATKPPAITNAPSTAASGPANPDSQKISAAFAKTKTASVFNLDARLSGSGVFVQQYPGASADNPFTILEVQGDFSGSDFKLDLSGLAALGADDMSKGLKVIRSGDKTYVHGPAKLLNAPTNDWYVLDSNSTFTMPFSLSTVLDQLTSANGNWSRYKKVRTGEALGGTKCDTYAGDQKSAVDTLINGFDVFKASASSVVAESGEGEFTICDDGYLHGFLSKVGVHDKANPARFSSAGINIDLAHFGVGAGVLPPLDVKGAPNSSSTAPTAPAATLGYDGNWEGKSSTDSIIAFSIKNNQMTNASLNYSVLNTSSERPSDCPVGDGGAYSGTVDPTTPITGNTFTLKTQGGSETKLTFTGTFKSATTVGGTLHLQGILSFCNKPYETEVTWTATKK